jgi:TBC1 domain family member 15
MRQRQLGSPHPASPSSGSIETAVISSGMDKGKLSAGDAVAKGIGAQKEKVISSELRNLLSRKIEKLDKSEIVKHGGGVGH